MFWLNDSLAIGRHHREHKVNLRLAVDHLREAVWTDEAYYLVRRVGSHRDPYQLVRS